MDCAAGSSSSVNCGPGWPACSPAAAAVASTRSAAAPWKGAGTVTNDAPADTVVKKLTTGGTFYLDKVQYKVDARRGLEQVLVIIDGDDITVADLEGELLIEHTRPAPGITYAGNGRPRGRRPNTDKPSPKS